MERNAHLSDDFSVFYSGLDTFDVALNSGIGKNLDGMFTCTPYNSKKMYGGGPDADPRMVQEFLNNIIRLRNIFMKGNIFSAYSYAMELLGCPGNYQADYDLPVPDNLKDEINEFMKEIEEI